MGLSSSPFLFEKKTFNITQHLFRTKYFSKLKTELTLPKLDNGNIPTPIANVISYIIKP